MVRRTRLFPLAALVALTAVLGAPACSSKSSPPAAGQPSRNYPPVTPPSWSADCDPLVPYHCGFPFPSNTQLKDDPTTPTGKRVSFAPGVLPTHAHQPTDPSAWSYLDGFSPGMNIDTDLPYAASTGLPDENHLADSITTSSPTILLDTSTGQLVPHIAELDVNGPTKGLDYWNSAFMIRPVVRLKDATRYIVAIRHVVDDKGTALDPSPEFKNLRDATPSTEASIEARRALYQDIFTQLSAAGIDKSDLQIAWDFTTASKACNTGDMISYRDQALAAVGADGPAYTIDTVTDNPNKHIRRRIDGHMTVPCFLDNCGLGTQGHPVLPKMHRGSDGKPAQNGTYSISFEVQIPNSLVAAGAAPGPVLQNGHGLLGNKEEGRDGYLASDADLDGMVTVVTDLQGMASEDYDGQYGSGVLTTLTGDIGTWKSMVDRQHMGLVNELLAMRMAHGKFAQDPKVTEVTADGHSPIDTTSSIEKRSFYRGDSQGGIFGTTYMTISTDVTRGVLGEPGAPYSLLLYRSQDFAPFFLVMGMQYVDSLDMNLALGLVQMLWDRTEPDGYVPYMTTNMLPGTPSHNVVIDCAIGDHQVTTLGAHFIARAIGAKQLKPVNREIFQIPDADGPFTGNGIVEVDFGLPPVPLGDEPMTAGDDPHDKVRVLPAIQQEEQEFLKNGDVKNFCGGPCKGT